MAGDYDIIILGSGSTAFAAALRAQSSGAKVVMIEKSVLGGTCINWGCIPSKTLIHAALFYQEARLGAAIGLACRRKALRDSKGMSASFPAVRNKLLTQYQKNSLNRDRQDGQD